MSARSTPRHLAVGLAYLCILLPPRQSFSTHTGNQNIVDATVSASRIVDVSWSPDDASLLYEVRGVDLRTNEYQNEIWLVDVSGRQRARRVVIGLPTRTKWRSLKAQWCPDGTCLSYYSDTNPDGGLWKIDLATGSKSLLLSAANWRPASLASYGTSPYQWSPDGKRLALIGTSAQAGDPGTNRSSVGIPQRVPGERLVNRATKSALLLLDVGQRRLEQIDAPMLLVQDIAWAPDSNRFAITASATDTDTEGLRLSKTDLYVVDATTKEVKPLVTQPGWDERPSWAPDGRRIAFVSQMGKLNWNAIAQIGVVSSSGGKPVYLGSDLVERFGTKPFDAPSWSADNRAVYVLLDAQLNQHWFRVPLDGTAATRVTSEGRFNRIVRPSHDGRQLAFVAETATHPGDVYVSETGSPHSQRLTNVNSEWDTKILAEVETISWPTGGTTSDASGVLIKPTGCSSARPCPLVVYLVGGPIMVRNGFNGGDEAYPVLPLVSHGVAVFLPNTRGRGGFGIKFKQSTKTAHNFYREPYDDVMAGVDRMMQSGIVDSTKLGLMGFSYGGGLAAYTVTRTGRFAAAAIHEGPTDQLRLALRAAGSRDYEDLLADQVGLGQPWSRDGLSTLVENSPVMNAGRIKTPILLECGAEGVLVEMCGEFFGALQHFAVPSMYILYPRTGHSTEEPLLLADSYDRVLRWFDFWLLGRGTNPLESSSNSQP